MTKIKFIGESDYDFENGEIYQLIKIKDREKLYAYFHAWISNKHHKIVYIPYSSLETFNENWEVVE